MNVIGVDFGTGDDIPIVSVIRKVGSKIELVDSCRIEYFNYNKYVSSKYQIVGSKEDLEKFQAYVNGGGI